MLRQTKALLALGSFEPPEAGVGEIMEAMNELFPRKVIGPYDTVDVIESMSDLAIQGLVGRHPGLSYELTPDGVEVVIDLRETSAVKI